MSEPSKTTQRRVSEKGVSLPEANVTPADYREQFQVRGWASVCACVCVRWSWFTLAEPECSLAIHRVGRQHKMNLSRFN